MPHGEWFMDRTFLTADLEQEAAEVRMDYELGSLAEKSSFDVKVFQLDCATALSPPGLITPVEAFPGVWMKVAMHHATIGNDGQDLEPVYLELNIDQATIHLVCQPLSSASVWM
jgi:hypothetical protein